MKDFGGAVGAWTDEFAHFITFVLIESSSNA